MPGRAGECRRYATLETAALSMSTIAETEHALSILLENPESIYRASRDMRLFTLEVLRLILIDTGHNVSQAMPTLETNLKDQRMRRLISFGVNHQLES